MNSAQLINDYLAGIPTPEIGVKYGIKPNGIYYYLKSAGIAPRGKRRFSCNDNLFSEESEVGKYWLGFCEADAHADGLLS
jgi:hypothetical protein